MKLKPFASLLLSVMALTVASCVDDDYDLSDIDTTASFDVNELMLPINIESIQLKTIFDISEDSKIKDKDGIYALIEDGDFQSSNIHVADFTITSPHIEPISKSMDFSITIPAKARKAADASNFVAYYILPEASTSFQTTARNVDPSIVGLGHVRGHATINLAININGLSDLIHTFRFDEIQLMMPKGLAFSDIHSNSGTISTSSYDPATGILDLSDYELRSSNGLLSLSLTLSDIETTPAGIELADGNINFEGECKLLSGHLSIALADINTNISLLDLPSQAGYTFTPTISDIRISHFTGTIKYDITGINIDPVSITDLPDFLNQEGTQLTISNPQIYLSLNNPLIEKGYNLVAQTGIRLTSNWSDNTSRSFTLDDGEIISATAANNTFLLSPSVPETFYGSYTNPTHVGFSSLSQIINGNGIPSTIDIEVINPNIPVQNVTDFALGTDINPVVGSYTIYAPLALGAGSVITYSDSVDGWLIKDDGSIDEDLDKLAISKLQVMTSVSTDLPLRAKLKAWPITLVNGRPTIMRSVEATADVNAMADNQALTITLEGDIRHLDGIYFEAQLQSSSEKVLTPDLKIQLNNIRARVTGNYTREL